MVGRGPLQLHRRPHWRAGADGRHRPAPVPLRSAAWMHPRAHASRTDVGGCRARSAADV